MASVMLLFSDIVMSFISVLLSLTEKPLTPSKVMIAVFELC